MLSLCSSIRWQIWSWTVCTTSRLHSSSSATVKSASKDFFCSAAGLGIGVLNTPIPKPAAEQKKSFEALLTVALDDECKLDVVQPDHDQICQRIELHKESKIPEPLLISKEEVKDVLSSCGVTEPHIAKFSVEYDEAFGFEAQLHPKNIINDRKFEINTPDVSIKVAPGRSDLIETRVIGGIKYILINAEENVEVNGVNIHIGEKEPELV